MLTWGVLSQTEHVSIFSMWADMMPRHLFQVLFGLSATINVVKTSSVLPLKQHVSDETSSRVENEPFLRMEESCQSFINWFPAVYGSMSKINCIFTERLCVVTNTDSHTRFHTLEFFSGVTGRQQHLLGICTHTNMTPHLNTTSQMHH